MNGFATIQTVIRNRKIIEFSFRADRRIHLLNKSFMFTDALYQIKQLCKHYIGDLL